MTLINRLKASLAEIEKHKAGWHQNVPAFGCQLCVLAKGAAVSDYDIANVAHRVRTSLVSEEVRMASESFYGSETT